MFVVVLPRGVLKSKIDRIIQCTKKEITVINLHLLKQNYSLIRNKTSVKLRLDKFYEEIFFPMIY
jgi:hypothetical protein